MSLNFPTLSRSNSVPDIHNNSSPAVPEASDLKNDSTVDTKVTTTTTAVAESSNGNLSNSFTNSSNTLMNSFR